MTEAAHQDGAATRWLPIPKLAMTLEGIDAEATLAVRISGATRGVGRLPELHRLLSVQVESANEELLRMVCQMGQLQHLVLEPFGLGELEPVAGLAELRTLIVSTGGWGRRGQVRSFGPLRGLGRLESVTTNLVPEDGDLMALAASPKIRSLRLAPGLYAMEALARLAAALRPEDRTGVMSGVVVLCTGAACVRCGAVGSQVLLSGARRGSACRACQREKLDRHMQRWAELVRESELAMGGDAGG